MPLRILPDENRDTVRRLTLVKNVVCRVVESNKPALIIGKDVYGALLERKDEQLEVGASPEVDDEGIMHRLEEMLDNAKLQGMSEKGLKRARYLIMENGTTYGD